MIWDYMLFLIVISGVIYTVIPDLFLHRWGIGSWKRQYTPGVAITFDDGPNPEITPKILDILDRYQVVATFFVVGEQAAKYPDLIKLIQARGHQIGAHSNHHKYAWFMSPWKTWQDWEECLANLESITCKTIDLVRPPWGTFNLATLIWIKLRKKQAVLWNIEGHDWQAKRKPEQITARIFNKTNEGSIMVLHDNGGEYGAPENTVLALDNLCRKIVEGKKLPFVRLEFPKWSGRHRLFFIVWEKWEHLFARIYHVERINSTNVIRLSRSLFNGPNLYGKDGQLLAKKGDIVGEIHLDNIRLQSQEKDINVIAIRVFRKAKESLPELARFVAEEPGYNGIKVFLGLTLIHQVIQKLGFQVQDVPNTLSNRLIGVLQKTIGHVYKPNTKTRKNTTKDNQPKLAWISRETLLELWLPKESNSKINAEDLTC